MSTDIGMLSDTMDVDALEDTGPYRSVQTTNLEPSGTIEPKYDRAQYDATAQGSSPQGGIDYVDQAVGGVVGYREDAAAGPISGFRSYRSRTQPFNGDFIGARWIPAGREQGYVGRQRNTTAQRAAAVRASDLPDRGDVLAGFFSPALATLLSKTRKGS